jgi:hypothetical protein
MFTLLPQEEKAVLKKEYILRVVIIFIFSLGASILVSVILLVPSYVLSSQRAKDAKLQKQALEASPVFKAKSDVVKSVTEAKSELSLVKSDDHYPTEIFKIIQGHNVNGVTIESYDFSSEAEGGSVTVTGKAQSRNVLLSFVQNLQSEKNFSKVDFPVSGLSPRSNLDFSVTVKGKF